MSDVEEGDVIDLDGAEFEVIELLEEGLKVRRVGTASPRNVEWSEEQSEQFISAGKVIRDE